MCTTISTTSVGRGGRSLSQSLEGRNSLSVLSLTSPIISRFHFCIRVMSYPYNQWGDGSDHYTKPGARESHKLQIERDNEKINSALAARCESQTWLASPPGWGCFCVFMFTCARERDGMLWNWWIFMLSVPVEWSTPVTNGDRQLSDLDARSPAGQIRLNTASKDEDGCDALLSVVAFPASGAFCSTWKRSPKNNRWVIWKK